MVKNILIIILLAVASVSLFLNTKFYKTLQLENKVVEVVDGDTFQLNSGKRVRLMAVDAPEYDRCGGQEAKNRLSALILNKTVNLQEEVTESYGRSLALVYVGNALINEILLKEGWGRTDYRKNSHRDILTAAFHEAQSKSLGIFGPLCHDAKANSDCVIKGNIDKATYKKFYHLPNCKQYDQIIIDKDIGETFFCTQAQAQKAGFVKASGCP